MQKAQISNKFESMSDEQLDAWLLAAIQEGNAKRTRERSYIASKQGKAKTRSLKKLVKEQAWIEEVIEFLQFSLGGAEGNGNP